MVGPALHARDHLDRHLVEVVGQIADGVEEAGAALPGSCAAGSRRLAAAVAGR
jgi:hypothetical protein